jgi:UDP-GlcNAc3NAcA epimerase
MPKVLTVVGARPQFVKAGVLAKVLSQLGGNAPFEEVMVHTGQHYDANMSDVFFQDLGIPAPKHALGVGSGTSGYQVGRIMEGLQEIVATE